MDGREVEYEKNVDKLELDFHDCSEKETATVRPTVTFREEGSKGNEDTSELTGYPKEQGIPITTLYFLLLLHFGRGVGLQMCSPSPLQRAPCTL